MKFIYQEKPIVVDILEDDTIETIRYMLSTLLGDDVYLFGKKYVSYTSKQVYDGWIFRLVKRCLVLQILKK